MPISNTGEIVEIQQGNFLPTPDAPWDTVIERFNKSMATADQMLELLLGVDGESGYLGDLKSLANLTTHSYNITTDEVNTDFNVGSVGSAPTFNRNDLDDFPTLSISDPNLQTIPLVDTSTLAPPDTPDDINPNIDWREIPYNSDIYQTYLSRLLNDLAYGATGLTDEVQTDIYNSGRERQRRANDRSYQTLMNDLTNRGATLPTGALLGALTELNGEILAQDSELNRTITISQAELAQKNNQVVIEQSRLLETLLRENWARQSERNLDYAKANADNILKVYAEKIRLYIATAEAHKMYVEAQVANLQGVVAYNKGLIDQYTAIIGAHSVQVDAISKKNSSVADVYKAEAAGFSAAADAIAKIDQSKIEKIKAEIDAARLNLEGQLAEVNANLETWKAEYSLKEKIATDMANLANQAVVGALSSVNAQAGISYTGSEARREAWTHSDSLGETHSYSHDPDAV